MALSASPESLAAQARRRYIEELVKGLVGVVQTTLDGARALADKPAEAALFARRRDLHQALHGGAQAWHRGIVGGLRHALASGAPLTRSDLPPGHKETLSLVPDDTIELEIVTSRLALAIMDRASWEFADLRSRVAHLEAAANSTRTTCFAPMCWRASSSTPGAWPA